MTPVSLEPATEPEKVSLHFALRKEDLCVIAWP